MITLTECFRYGYFSYSYSYS